MYNLYLLLKHCFILKLKAACKAKYHLVICNCHHWPTISIRPSFDMNCKCFMLLWLWTSITYLSITWYQLRLGNITIYIYIYIWLGFICISRTQKSEGILCGKVLTYGSRKPTELKWSLTSWQFTAWSAFFCLSRKLNWKTLKCYQNWICFNTKNVVFSHPTKLHTAVLSVTR